MDQNSNPDPSQTPLFLCSSQKNINNFGRQRENTFFSIHLVKCEDKLMKGMRALQLETRLLLTYC
jgi:hypothetical protein